MKKTVIVLMILSCFVHAEPWPIIHEKVGGALNNQCTASEVNELVYYSAQTCELRFYDVNLISPSETSPYENYLDLGNCGNMVSKYILDGKLYKTTYNMHLYAPIPPFAPEPELYIENTGPTLKNCQSSQPTSPTTQYPMVLIMADDFKVFVLKSLKMGTDKFNKPVIIMNTTNGDVVCDGYTKDVVMVDMDDLIFISGFE